MKFDFDDILIVPESLTEIESRYVGAGVDPFYYLRYKHYPLFTAPMDTVVDESNYLDFTEQHIRVVLPRTVKKKDYKSGVFNSFGLGDIDKFLVEHNNSLPQNFLIDIANGHMRKIIQVCEKIKSVNRDHIVMAGNIANPNTYAIYARSGVVDYARVGIGNGNGCLTTQQTGVGYPMGSLVNECYEIKFRNGYKTKIVADGGMKDYRDIIKALALGADYVMCGSIFNKALESASPSYFGPFKLNRRYAEFLFDHGFALKKYYRGMSTKAAQKALGNVELKTSEGVERFRKVEYRLSGWIKNFDGYLRSTLSYTNSNTLEDFIGRCRYELITENAFLRYKK